ncbi:MAG: hypothetical protein PHV68_04590, partial [Candidatus Gastranaerophilales bacterium]|nr:hypothetical protein [Candidatus Gastranaerophilales bacterium]
MNNNLEKGLLELIEKTTPEYIKKTPIVNIDDKNEINFILKKEHLDKYDEKTNPEGLGLKEWFENYEKEAKASTAGIRGNQNILYPWDTRFPINLIGILLATEAKALVADKKYPEKQIHKIAASEVRYNSKKYVDLIARIQAAHKVKTHVVKDRKTIPIWLASFLAFKLDLLGGEYVTSSHGISVKTATKDLNNQGSQYLPEESTEFVEEMKRIFTQVEQNGNYEIKIANANNEYISEKTMKILNNGVDLYVEYLKNGVASKSNLNFIKNAQKPIIIENVGGSAYQTLSKVFENLKIADKYIWFNTEEDPFFHGIGKIDTNPKTGKKEFFDYSVDVAILKRKEDGTVSMPVIETMNYVEKLTDKPAGTVILMTDPDHDRLSLAQIENINKIAKLNKLGIDYIKLDDNRILTVYTPNQSFLITMDFHMKQLKAENQWQNHSRFIIKTTASALAWDEWAKNNDIKVINTPVGFKELANVMKKVEKQIIKNPDKDVLITDIFGSEINLGKQPRLVFAGEESGGMIIGPEKLIESNAGRIAVAMREKSATEAIIISSALACKLENQNKMLSDNLEQVFYENNIIAKYDIREDIAYYNESEPDIEALKKAKTEGEALRTQNDIFYLSIAVAIRTNKLTFEQGKEILQDTFKELDFFNLKAIKFVGDGTYLEFDNKYIEIRPSGTDAKTKAYGAGDIKEECIKFA